VELERDGQAPVGGQCREHTETAGQERVADRVGPMSGLAHTRTHGAPSATAVSSTAVGSAGSSGPVTNAYEPYDAIATPAASDAARRA